jgi:hypothetical protein
MVELWTDASSSQQWVVTDYGSYVTIGIDVNHTSRVYLGRSYDDKLTLWESVTDDQKWNLTETSTYVNIHSDGASGRQYLGHHLGRVALWTVAGADSQWDLTCRTPCWRQAGPVSIQLDANGAGSTQERTHLSVLNDGTELRTWLSATSDQLWLIQDQGDHFTIQLSGAASASRSYLASHTDGSAAALWTTTSTASNMFPTKWIIEEHADTYYYTNIKLTEASQSRSYLGVNSDGTLVDLWSQAGANQRWTINCSVAGHAADFVTDYGG